MPPGRSFPNLLKPSSPIPVICVVTPVAVSEQANITIPAYTACEMNHQHSRKSTQPHIFVKNCLFRIETRQCEIYETPMLDYIWTCMNSNPINARHPIRPPCVKPPNLHLGACSDAIIIKVQRFTPRSDWRSCESWFNAVA